MVARLRSFRADDALWLAALTRARSEGTTLTEVIVAALSAYGSGSAVRTSVAAVGSPAAAPSLLRDAGPAERCPHPKGRVLKGLCMACGNRP
jgi:hypothetical protein